jgi:integrase
VNSQVHRLCRFFNWGASHELIPIEVFHRLKSVPALRRGRSEARETEAVKPVAIELVDAVRPFLNRQVRALVDLQLLTGARGGELFKLRPIDIQIDKKKGVWTIDLCRHKSAHLGKSRTLILGPKAQKVVKPFLTDRALDTCLFRPADADRERRAALAAKRKTPRSCGNTPGANRVASPRKKPGDHYTASSYRRAIERACEKVGIPAWHPHQLRHAAATAIRRDFGLEAAQLALGHSSSLVTDAVYAERDLDRMVEVMKAIG